MQRLAEEIPQDLRLIHEIVKDLVVPTPTNSSTTKSAISHDDSIDSSSSERDSDDDMGEIEANLLDGVAEEGTLSPKMYATSSASHSDSSSESDLEPVEDIKSVLASLRNDADDDEEAGTSHGGGGAYFGTKNEVFEAEVPIPDVDEVGVGEILEIMGEVMSIVENSVIVKGVASQAAGRASEKALDAGTLLVFDDRKVLGYVYDTFGPTFQPLYQVRFNERYPLDTSKVRMSRQVFHVPERSKFVFLNALTYAKGSDASNVNDEEPPEDEVEFSDDEKEAAFKSRLKWKRAESRAGSALHSGPTPSQMRDQELVESLADSNPYAERGFYDIDYTSSGPPRPPPAPYEDPYDEYNPAASTSQILEPPSPARPKADASRHHPDHSSGFRPGNRPPRGRGRRVRGKGGSGSGYSNGVPRFPTSLGPGQSSLPGEHQLHEPYDPSVPLPTISTAPPSSGNYVGHAPLSPNPWSFPSPHNANLPHSFQSQYVQPHINPRFASALGINLGLLAQQPTHGGVYGQDGSANHGLGASAQWSAYPDPDQHTAQRDPRNGGAPS